ncbi:putative N-acetyl-LL-diaminopimelate aminotransferase [Neobacillus rhizosphaerae]|uniref:Aminotransferase n=1 Tax=Neobacillus rhizosphaerae TaxID=2880965 RepID=A0ABM9ENF0_9BACI|nr:aminotransferase [Neobacillus rhizosphaerae]CAH2714141.1 putative N-acetyl-LL-diaminopimelate aminotransferase [Neobacillus rhizosphaerae]
MKNDYAHYISQTAKVLQPSGIRKFFDLAAGMKDVISLGVGEPDFITPWNIREAAILSMEQGFTSYTANAGLLELREEISIYLRTRFSVEYDAKNQIIVTVGASQAIDLAFRAILNQGDEVLIVEPAFVSYAPLVSLAGGKPIAVSTSAENGFKVTPEQIEQAITEKTKAILLCFPNNPTGTSLNETELIEIAKMINKHDLLVVSDEIYAELTYDETFTSFASIDGMYERTILINGFSKGFAMTGWRLGMLAAPKELVEVMLKIFQYTTMCAPTMLQYGAIEALRNTFHEVESMQKSYRRRRNYVVQTLNNIGLDCHTPGGAFYVFPSIRATRLTSEQFAEELLMKEKVAVVPGNVFGESGEGYIRCSYASSMPQLQEALKRMQRFIEAKGVSSNNHVGESIYY